MLHVRYRARWPHGLSCGEFNREAFALLPKEKADLRGRFVGEASAKIYEKSKETNEAVRKKEVDKKKTKKKSNSIVRKLSLNKFKMSSEQEPRHTPEGGDSSRSQSQSSQESPYHSADSPLKLSRKGHQAVQGLPLPECDKPEKERSDERLEERSEKIEKPVSTVTVVQRKSPSLTIRSTIPAGLEDTRSHDSPNREKHTQTSENQSKIHCSVSTLPYAISKWPEQAVQDARLDPSKKPKLSVKSDSESAVPPKTPPAELRRKLSLLEEKRAIFQRRRYDTSHDTSDETVQAHTVDDETAARLSVASGNDDTKRRARHISVRKFDTFSTFEGTFDEDTGVGYLAGIEEDFAESVEHLSDSFASADAMPTHTVGESSEKTRSISQDSGSSQNNAPSAGLGEKREHLYKILVIGELGAGKTSIIKRYVHQFFSQHYRATIGVDFALKVLNWDPHTIIRLQLWDIAGQERFGNMTRVYYKEAVGAFIVFDVTRSATLDAVVKWKQDLDSKVQLPDGSPIPCVLLANKCDQQKEGLVNSPGKMDDYCKEKNFAGWFETSAKENINIEEAARFLVNKILQNDQIIKGNGTQEQSDGERFALNQSPTSTKKSCSC
ncbi:ras and EF-hand domain-containing protein homolog isoform X2 [Cephus cinctus]|uniref:Ras and EF-hand domain-containing protein homolog isoform X2 n=1 Tax=Cephus cinctus TaxID=211228 RepID=A0AAJ7BJC1_CEPCN|nr:ras and EF-hand domain-containing protein homolog isoform X2 [Cephus cinctus]